MSRLQEKRTWLAGGAGLAVLIAAVSWLGVISPKLSSASNLRDQSAAAQTQNGVLMVKVAKLKQENDKAGQLRAGLRTALAALPFDSGLPAFTRQVSAQATRNHVTLIGITVGSISAVKAAAPIPAATSTTAAIPAGSSTTAPATVGTAATPMAIPITLTSSGRGKDQLAFLKAIRICGPRRALIVSTTLGPNTVGKAASIDKASTMTTQLNVFSAPLTAAQKAQLEKMLSGK